MKLIHAKGQAPPERLSCDHCGRERLVAQLQAGYLYGEPARVCDRCIIETLPGGADRLRALRAVQPQFRGAR